MINKMHLKDRIFLLSLILCLLNEYRKSLHIIFEFEIINDSVRRVRALVLD